jgi:pimeloyl-ACP methyl ester carboxylesterase
MFPLIGAALQLLRLSAEALLLAELNRLFGRLLAPRTPHPDLARVPAHAAPAVAAAEAALLRHAVAARVDHVYVPLLRGQVLHTLVATRPPATTSSNNSTEECACPGTARLAAHAQRPRRPLVILHGHGMCAAFFAPNVDALLDMGYDAVYAPDLLGWGRSSRPAFAAPPKGPVADAALAFFLDPLDAWLAAMLPDGPNAPPLALLGHSLGGYLAHEFAARHANRIARLILVSPAALTRTVPLGMAAWFAATPQRFVKHGGLISLLAFLKQYPPASQYNLPGFRDLAFCTNALAAGSGDAAAASFVRFIPPILHGPLWLRWLRALLHLHRWRAECVRPLLEHVRPCPYPTEIVAGDRDVLVNIEAVRALHRAMLALGNPVKLSVLQCADHSPHISLPHQFAKALLRGAGFAVGHAPTVAKVRSRDSCSKRPCRKQ